MALSVDLGGRPCVVVGGTGGGIGSAIAVAAAEAGSPVGVISHNRDHANEMLEQLKTVSPRCGAAVADVTDEVALVEALGELARDLGPIRHLANVIGGSLRQYYRAEEFDMDFFDLTIARNVRYVAVACREVAAALIASGQTGSIVNISSGASRGAPLLAAYSVAKAGLEAYTRTIALEWGPLGIRANAIGTGSIKTPRGGFGTVEEVANSIPLRRRGESTEVAAVTLFLLSDLASYTTGQTLNVDGGQAYGKGGTTQSAFEERRKLADAMLERGVSQADVAREFGVAPDSFRSET